MTRHTIIKAWRTARLCTTLFYARMLGDYQHTIYIDIDNGLWAEFAKYQWRGRIWYIPTNPATRSFE